MARLWEEPVMALVVSLCGGEMGGLVDRTRKIRSVEVYDGSSGNFFNRRSNAKRVMPKCLAAVVLL